MKITQMLKRTVRPFVNITTWMGYSQLKETTISIKDTIQNLFIPQTAAFQESFEDAMKRLHLTEKDVKDRIIYYRVLAVVWFLIMLAVLAYGVYLAGNQSIRGFIACIGISCITLAQAFRNHFWSFQLSRRKLGCTFKEWLNAGFSGGDA